MLERINAKAVAPLENEVRVFYATSGPSDLIRAHLSRTANTPDPGEVSVTFSSQIEDFCESRDATALMVSTLGDGRSLTDGRFTFRHIGKPSASGVRYHLGQISYGLRLLSIARKFKPTLAIVDSGATHYFMLLGFRLLGIPVVPVLHNALWPKGFPPQGLQARLLQSLDRLFWRRGPKAVIAVSPEVGRQVRHMSADATYPVIQARAQFYAEYFRDIPPAPAHQAKPFRVMFAGRLAENKGGLDIARMAAYAESNAPGLVHWTICGHGPDSERLRTLVSSLGVGDVVNFRGWTSPADMKIVLGQSHCCIVPTRSDFAEGLAMTAVEAVLAGRPLVTNSVVPALELLQPASIEAKPDDVESHAEAVMMLARNPDRFKQMRQGCQGLADDFLDQNFGLAAALMQIDDCSLGRADDTADRLPST